MRTAIAYFRVSSAKQQSSGLGLEGQEDAVNRFAASSGYAILKTYTEIESGKNSDRKELAKAIGHAKMSRSVLIVAKLDRLARNVAFLSSLMDSGVEFVAVDNPSANRLTVHILAAVAEAEAKQISDRTKSALAIAKARGVKLGSARPDHWQGREDRRGWKKASEVASLARTKHAREAYEFLAPTIAEMRAQGISYQSIADHLNSEGHLTRRGKAWTAMTVLRAYQIVKG